MSAPFAAMFTTKRRKAYPLTSCRIAGFAPCAAREKSVFSPQEMQNDPSPFVEPILEDSDASKLTPGELAALFSNPRKSCEKQYKFEEQALFLELADYYTRAMGSLGCGGRVRAGRAYTG